MQRPAPRTLLSEIKFPSDLRRLEKSQLQQVAGELRAELVDAVSTTGGHFGAGLGVVELTVAIHYVFDTPRDRLIWDVSHQAYPHKILTGRGDRIRAPSARAAVCPASRSEPRANTTISARPIRPHPFRPRSASQRRAILRATISMSSV